jgi:hypothetical protein
MDANQLGESGQGNIVGAEGNNKKFISCSFSHTTDLGLLHLDDKNVPGIFFLGR